jgi:alkylation response protein AidB-like acyl-CoA dehydrogenase
MTVDLEFRADLRETARAFLSREASPAQLRAVTETRSAPVDLDARIAELGWGAVEIPEEYGGLGAQFGDLVVLLHELGRVIAPATFVSTAVLGVAALQAASEPLQREWYPSIADGHAVVTAALAGASGDPGSIDLEAVPAGEGWELDGVAGFVPDLVSADAVIMGARNRATGVVHLFLVPAASAGLERETVALIDQTRRYGRLRASSLRLGPDSEIAENAGEHTREWLLARAATAVAADAVGGSERVLEMTIEYLNARVQFGRPIGSFQSLKHRCADMLFLLEGSRGAVDHAAERCVDHDPAAASIAKAYAGDAYVKIAQEGVQMHGGIGYTWEHDLHLYLKRARLDQLLFGDSSFHRAVLAGVALSDQ